MYTLTNRSSILIIMMHVVNFFQARCLGSIGGRNVRSMTTNILRRILLDEVAELYSLTGKQMKNSTKKSFLRTETCQLIFRKHTSFLLFLDNVSPC